MAYSGNAAQNYNDGAGSHGRQLVPYAFIRKSLTDVAKDRIFGQLCGTKVQPLHKGKEMTLYHYVHVLSAENVNDQGIDATGQSIASVVTINVIDLSGTVKAITGYGTDAATALTAAKAQVLKWAKEFVGPGVGDTYDAVKTAFTTAGWTVTEGTAVPGSGNFWGSSKDIGTITGKFPALGEHGGRVNRVGNTRLTIKSNIHNFGFFEEFTEDSLQFDSDPELYSHITAEAAKAANEVVEAMTQINLINAAGVVLHGGEAVAPSELDESCVLTYGLLHKLNSILNENRCPKSTSIVTGSTNVDTRTIDAARYMYIGNELTPTLEKMTNPFGEAAFVPVYKYAAAGNTASGEIGSVGSFRFIEAMEMTRWEGAGATASASGLDTHFTTNGKYDVFPGLVVGSGSFYTVSLGTMSKSKFKILVKKPGIETADRTDPYGKTGFFSYQWWYGYMTLYPERIACVKVTAPMSV